MVFDKIFQIQLVQRGNFHKQIQEKTFNKKENLFEPSSMELTSDFYVTSISTGS